jgi:GT2 family glycosyltransferase
MHHSTALTPPRVAIVLVNWNGWRECVECIDSVLAQSHRNFHVFIVDNDSQDRSIEHIVEWCSGPEADPGWRTHRGVDRYTDRTPHAVPCRVVDQIQQTPLPGVDDCLTIIRAGRNSGYAGGCNAGMSAAGLEEFDFFWFLNPDTVVERSALTELVTHARRDPGMGIVGSTLLFYDRPDIVHALGGGRLNRRNGYASHIGEGSPSALVGSDGSAVERELAWICGASMLVSTSFVREVGPMEEDYFLYYEEADWAMRGTGRFRCGFAPRSIVFHKSGANSSKLMPLFTAGFYYRSRLRFVSRFFPERMAAAKRRLFVEMLRHIARGRWSAARLVGSTLRWTP